MVSMFNGCENLISLDLSSFNTTNVNDMGWMFSNCTSLISLDLSSIKTNNVNEICRIFDGCSSIKKENVKNNNSNKKLCNEINKLKN